MQVVTTTSDAHKSQQVSATVVETVIRHFMEESGKSLLMRTHQETLCLNCLCTLNSEWQFCGLTMNGSTLQFSAVPPGQEKPCRYQVRPDDCEKFLSWISKMSKLMAKGKAPKQGVVPNEILLQAGVSEITTTMH